MSVPAAEHWFSTSIRRNRQSYIFANIILISIMIFVVVVLLFFEAGKSRFGELVFVAFYVPFVVCEYFLTAQRLRDMSVTGWLALLWIPIGIADEAVGSALSLAAFLVLATVPGTQGNNRYGPDPLAEDPSWDSPRG